MEKPIWLHVKKQVCYAYVSESNYDSGVDLGGIQTVFMWPAIYFIVVGSLRFIACFIGCCGSIKSSTCLLKSVSVIELLLFSDQ